MPQALLYAGQFFFYTSVWFSLTLVNQGVASNPRLEGPRPDLRILLGQTQSHSQWARVCVPSVVGNDHTQTALAVQYWSVGDTHRLHTEELDFLTNAYSPHTLPCEEQCRTGQLMVQLVPSHSHSLCSARAERYYSVSIVGCTLGIKTLRKENLENRIHWVMVYPSPFIIVLYVCAHCFIFYYFYSY